MKYYYWLKLRKHIGRLKYDVTFAEASLKEVIEEFSNENFKEKTGLFEHENFLATVEMTIDDIQDLKKLSNKSLKEIEGLLKDLVPIIKEK